MADEPTMEQEAERFASSLAERTEKFRTGDADPYEDDDEGDIPETYGHDIVIRVHCYGGGPAGGVEFDCQRGRYGLDWVSARTWHQDWFQPKGYAPLDNDTADFLFQHWGIGSALGEG